MSVNFWFHCSAVGLQLSLQRCKGNAMQIVLHVLVSLSSALFCVTYSNSEETNGHGTLCQQKPFPAAKVINSTQPVAFSPPLLREWAEKDEIIYAVVRIHYNDTDGDDCYHQAMRRYLRHFELTTGSLILHFHEDGKAPYRAMNVAWNPLATYHLISRFHTILKPLVMMLSYTDEHQYALARQICSVTDSLAWPTENDIRSTATSILRLQYVYDLNTTDFSHGIIAGKTYGIALFFDDCSTIGKQALAEGYFYLAVEWFEEALRMLGSDPQSGSEIQRKSAEKNIELARGTHDEDFDKSHPSDSMFFRQKLSKEPINRERRRTYLQRNLKAAAEMKSYGALYRALCSGESLKSKEEKSRLFCHYETKVNPAWSINPLKVEILSLKPLLVVQYHDILSKSSIDRLRSAATFQLIPSFTFGGTSWASRTSVFVHIDDSMFDPRTVELITGLRVGADDWDGLQVVAYSSGNHMATHVDGRSWTEMGGHAETSLVKYRIATFLIYLSDVIEGGATVFPMSGLAVKPAKGSAIFWYNWHRSGELDLKTLHGSCPVIIGEKWVANKQILGSYQVVNPLYRCGKHLNASFEISVNGRPIEVF